jgi:predicted  nucleic acid-binding Zn-ribbon protein
MTAAKTTVERLARIEALLEGIDKRLLALEQEIKQVEQAHNTINADYQKLKNRAWGLLAGVSMIAGAVGAKLREIFQ